MTKTQLVFLLPAVVVIGFAGASVGLVNVYGRTALISRQPSTLPTGMCSVRRAASFQTVCRGVGVAETPFAKHRVPRLSHNFLWFLI